MAPRHNPEGASGDVGGGNFGRTVRKTGRLLYLKILFVFHLILTCLLIDLFYNIIFMSAQQHMNNLLRRFGEYVGLPELCLDENQLCTLSFDDLAVCMSLSEKRGDLLVYADVGILPCPVEGGVFQRLLEANCLFARTRGSTLGVRHDDERNVFVVALARQVRVETLQQEDFQNLLQEFIDTEAHWQQELVSLRNFSSGQKDTNGLPTPSSVRA